MVIDPQIITTLVTSISLLVLLGGLLLRLDRRFSRLEQRTNGLATGIKSLNQQVSSVVGIQSSILAALHRAGSLPDEDYRRLVTNIAEHLASATQPFVDSITATTNPLSAQEARRFQQLVAKAQESEFFTREEVEEYNRLLERVQRDRGDDPAIWPLVALGAFLLGLYLGGRRQE